jgi:hypothetical protein
MAKWTDGEALPGECRDHDPTMVEHWKHETTKRQQQVRYGWINH